MSTTAMTIDPEQMLGEVEVIGRDWWEEIHRRAGAAPAHQQGVQFSVATNGRWFLTQMCARFSPSRSAAPWEEGADALVPANQR